MEKKYIMIIIGFILLSTIGLSTIAIADSPHDSFIVCGQVTTSATALPNASGAHPNGVTVTAKNVRTGDTVKDTTQTDANGLTGTFQVNLGNLDDGWMRGDNITLTASGTYAGSKTFTLNMSGTITQQDIVVRPTAGGGGGKREAGIDVEPQGTVLIYIIFGILLVAIMGAALYMYEKDRT
jgi:hypothetical protein